MNGTKPTPKKQDDLQPPPTAEQWREWLAQDDTPLDRMRLEQWKIRHPLRKLLNEGILPSGDHGRMELIVGCVCVGTPTVLREVLKRTRHEIQNFRSRTQAGWLGLLWPRLDTALAKAFVEEFLIPRGRALQTFDIKGWDLSSAESVKLLCDGLAQCDNLEMLKLENCYLTSSTLGAILDSVKGSWPRLCQLSFSSNAIGNAGAFCVAERLHGLPSLRELRLEACDITEAGALSLASALKGSPSLQVLDLTMNLVGDSAAAQLIAALADSPRLTELELANCRLGAECADALGTLLDSKSPLQTLRLGWNRLVPSPLFLRGLGANKTLRNLHVEHCGSTFLVEKIAGVLATNSSIRTLVLNGNPFNEQKGVEAVMVMLLRSKLAAIDLSDCQLDDKSCALLLRTLTKNSTLETLDLSGNLLKSDACGQAGNLLSINRTLKRLDLRACGIDDLSLTGLTRPLNQGRSKSALAWLDMSHNKVGKAGLAVLLRTLDSRLNLVHLLIGKNSFDLASREVQDLFNNAIKNNTALTSLDYHRCHGADQYDGSVIERRLWTNARLNNPSTDKYLLDLLVRFSAETLQISEIGKHIWAQLRDSIDPDKRYVQLRAALRLSEVCRGISFGAVERDRLEMAERAERAMLEWQQAEEIEQFAADMTASNAAEDAGRKS
ncbi:MAG: hypothetical protein KKC79_09630 [Gammaproteobacteria bacterium]|nr:hypothetical protein [Gammaproteobacteria bacterium]MBU1441726.1 hypothetical protein [Gammaproteobacteria bacterium]MBU2408893.1 hypothetical protein [Gammaproteobacteria bacterium]